MILKRTLIMFVLIGMAISSCVPSTTPTPAETSPAPTAIVQATEAATDTPTLEPVVPVKIKIGLFPYTSYAPLYYAQAEGYYAEQGLDVEFVDFSKQSDAVVALATGQIDVSGGVLDVASLTAISEGTGLKIVADKGFVDPKATCPYGAWMVRKDILESGELDNIQNLKGKKVVLTKAGFFEYAMDKLLEPAGLSVSDLDIVEMPAPARLEAFQTSAIDIAQVGEPWITRTLATGAAQVWQPFETTQSNAQYAVIWFGPNITKNDQNIGDRFMTAYLKAVRQYNQGKTERNVALMAEFTKSTPEEVSSSCWQAFTNDGHVNLEFISDFQNWALKKGYIDHIMTVDEFWDGKFLDYAQKQLQ